MSVDKKEANGQVAEDHDWLQKQDDERVLAKLGYKQVLHRTW
jgi:hypothetical protein